jgi:hypothetical protein
MLTHLKKTNALLGQTHVRSMATGTIKMKDLQLKHKFHNNRNVPWLFKNSATDDYVSMVLADNCFRSEDTWATTPKKSKPCWTLWA